MSQMQLDQLRVLAADAKLDGVALVPGPNLTYITGVHYHLSTDRPLLMLIPLTGDVTVLIPTLEQGRLIDSAPFPIRFFTYTDAEGYLPAFEQACKSLNWDGARIGVEGLRMRVLEGQLIDHFSPGATVIPADDALMQLRLHKTPDEIASMRRAIAISETALESILGQIHVGVTEQQIMNWLLAALSEHGADGNSFEPIVLGGPHSALPHGMASNRPLQNGDLLLFDYGVKVDGYPADITRVFAIGELDAELANVYAVVLAANEAGIRAGGPGIPAQAVDCAARKVINDAGYGEYFTHRAGHGLGLDIHEPPFMREGNLQLLEPGMVYTVEPGIYLPGKGGVRIEDNVVVTDQGIEVLTHFPKALRTLG